MIESRLYTQSKAIIDLFNAKELLDSASIDKKIFNSYMLDILDSKNYKMMNIIIACDIIKNIKAKKESVGALNQSFISYADVVFENLSRDFKVNIHENNIEEFIVSQFGVNGLDAYNFLLNLGYEIENEQFWINFFNVVKKNETAQETINLEF